MTLSGMPGLPQNEKLFLEAAAVGDAKKVIELLAKGVPVDVRDPDDMPWDQTALMYAAANGHLEVVRLLLKSGANVQTKDKAIPGEGGGQQPLHYAMRSKDVKVIELLLAAGANPYALDKSGDTPMNVAVEEGNVAAVRLLLERGFDPNRMFVSRRHNPALCCAVYSENAEILCSLLEAGADPNVKDETNSSPLTIAARVPDKIAVLMVGKLIEAGAEIEHLDEIGSGATALARAVFARNAETIKVLIRAGAGINRVYEDQGGTLVDAVEKRIRVNAAVDFPESKCAVDEWHVLLNLLLELGGKRQSELEL